MNVLNTFLFVVFPYVAVIVFVFGAAYRYRQNIGVLVVFVGHLVAFLLPRATLAWNSIPLRLIALEVTAFVFGLSMLIGLAALMFRRLTNPRIRAVTTRMDIAIELLLLGQVVLGCWIALGFRWGSSWFAADLSPYLWSLVTLTPETGAVFALPWVIKLHIAGAFAIAFMVPFTRLVHFVVAPLHYIVRPYQQVIWNWDRKAIRDPNTPWSKVRPKAN
jgi:nitrate reductase gamma subunit